MDDNVSDDVPDSVTSVVADLITARPGIGAGHFVMEMRRRSIDPAAALLVLPVLLGLGQ